MHNKLANIAPVINLHLHSTKDEQTKLAADF